MIKAPAALALTLLLAGCATTSDPKPAVCDGKHRRPANPYGSVLPSAQATSPSSTSGATPPTPGPQSSIDLRSIQPCGARG